MSAGNSQGEVSVQVLLMALAQILDHHLRRPEAQDRVFGILLGHRSNSKTIITSALGLPYIVKGKDLRMDFEDLDEDAKTLTLLSQAAHSSNGTQDEPLLILGWYTTSPEMTSITPLIHDTFVVKLRESIANLPVTAFSSSSSVMSASASSDAIQLTLDPSDLSFKTFVAAPAGLGGRSTAVFVPVVNELKISPVERPTLEALLSANTSLSKGISTANPLQQFKTSLSKVSNMLDTVSEHVEAVLSGEKKGDPKLAALLLDTLSNSVIPSLNQGQGEYEGFESHLADLLMISYLSNLAQYQMELSARLALIQDKSGF